ncbi:MAG: hypothetical protein WCG26_05055 [Chloroflexales bacterium]
MSDPKAARLAAIRAANAQKQAVNTPTAAVDAAPAPVLDKAARLAAIRATNAQNQAVNTPTVAAERNPIGAPPVTSPTIQLTSTPVVAPTAPAAQVPAVSAPQFGLLLLAAVSGAFVAAFALPAWLPGLSASLLGAEPKAYWYLARSTAFVAYGLLWLSMALGLMMTNKLSRVWPGGPVAFDLHQHASILGLAFGLFHALILLGDRYSNYTLGQILIPFASTGFQPFWVGLGQVSLYLMGLVGLSFYFRPLIGRQVWRVIHFLSFVIFGLVMAHGVRSGSDTGTVLAQGIYWFTGGSLIFLTVYRVLVSMVKPTPAVRPTAQTPREQLVKA